MLASAMACKAIGRLDAAQTGILLAKVMAIVGNVPNCDSIRAGYGLQLDRIRASEKCRPFVKRGRRLRQVADARNNLI